MKLFDTALIVGKCGVQRLMHFFDEAFWKAQSCVVSLDRHFDVMNAQVRQVAVVVLATPTHEVAVQNAGSALGLRVDEATGSFLRFAACAEEHSLEIVAVDTVALTIAAPKLQDLLNAVVQFLVDQRLVTSWIQVTLVDHESGVVRVSEHLMECAV